MTSAPPSHNRTGADYATALRVARDRLVLLVDECSDGQWSRALSAEDPRPVGVVVDHVAHAYEYLAGWIRELIAGASPEVNADVIDALNGGHARLAAEITRSQAIDHLQRSGDALLEVVSSLTPAALQIADGRVQRFVEIAIRHTSNHLAEVAASCQPADSPTIT